MKWLRVIFFLPIALFGEDDFFWGVAISEYQNSGAETIENCQWADWEKLGNPYICGAQSSGKSVDHYGDLQSHIDMLEELGVNSFRFSVEWALVEPEEGVFDKEVLEHYLEEIQELKRRGITPMITLHHFTDPTWFTKKGAWEKEENIKYFVRYSEKVFQFLHEEVKLWCVINEPNAYAFMGYFLGEFPPGEKNPQMMGEVLSNLLKAHVATYKAIKPIDMEASIGFVHAYLRFEPYHSWNPIESIPCSYLTHIFNEGELQFFREGKFNFSLPFVANVEYQDQAASLCFDFIGLNFYSRALISMVCSSKVLDSVCYPGEVMTDMPFAVYPEGLYLALRDLESFNKPIYITENGCPDLKDNRREMWIEGYLAAMHKAISEGVDVRGYYHWTLVDNFEWAKGWNMEFGLFRHLKDGSFQLKEGAKAYQRHIANQRALVNN